MNPFMCNNKSTDLAQWAKIRNSAIWRSRTKAKTNIFWNFFQQNGPEEAGGMKKKCLKTLILVFVVIMRVQPHHSHICYCTIFFFYFEPPAVS